MTTTTLLLASLQTSNGPATPLIYLSTEDAATHRISNSWQAFFKTRGFDTVKTTTTPPKDSDKSCILAFETEAACPLATELGLALAPLHASKAPDAHVITVRHWKGRTLALVVGRTTAGTEAGAEFLFSKIRCDLNNKSNWTVTCPPLELFRAPFIRGREVALTPTGRIMPGDDCNYENWNQERLQRYVAFLKACGFNSLQIMELVIYHAKTQTWDRGYRAEGHPIKPVSEIQAVLYTLSDAAHAQGMTVTQYIWGSPADGCLWDDLATRRSREEFITELAKRYAPKVDHIITHWKDEGREGGYKTPLTATMFIRDAYQKINPKIQVTCDAWWNKELYQGIDDETYATKDIAIAIERWYDAKYAAQIIKSGRKVGIWGWYLSDFEMTYGSHLYSKTLDQYFSSLPPEASQQVDWLSLELCFHGLPSQINLYIVGRKMWDPKANLHDIMRDYCAAVYGPENAATMVKVYETVEAGQKEVRYGMVQHDRYPIVLGTPEFKAKVDQLLPELLKVELPKGWIANFPFVNDPQSDIDHLTKDLKAFAATPVTLTAQTPAPATTAKPVTQTTTAPVKEVPPRDPNNYFLKPKDVVLFLGNSITEGAQPEIDLIKADLKKHYPSLAEGPDAVTFVLGGVSGEQAAAGKVRVKALIAKHKPTVCVVCYGTCEVTFKKEDGFIPAMKEIIHELKNANVQVVIVSAPPPSARNWKQPDAWPASQFEAGIPMMVSQAFQLTCEESLLYVNANQAISSEVTKTGGEFTTDGIHLTPDGYRIMAQALQAAWSFGKPATK